MNFYFDSKILIDTLNNNNSLILEDACGNTPEVWVSNELTDSFTDLAAFMGELLMSSLVEWTSGYKD